MNKKLYGSLLALFAGIFWGLSGCCSQYIFTHTDIRAQWLSPVRLISAGTCLTIISLIKYSGEIKQLLTTRYDRNRLLLFSLVGLMITQYSFFAAIQHTNNAATVTVIQYTEPAMLLVWLCIKGKRKPAAAEIFVILFSIVGIFLIATHGDLSGFAQSPIGLAWSVISAIALVFYNVALGDVGKKYHSVVLTGLGLLIAGLTLGLLTRVWTRPAHFTVPAFFAMLGVTLVGCVFAFTMYTESLKYISPLNASILSTIEPVASVVIGAFWLKTKFTMWDLCGFALIISAVILLNIHDRKKAAAHTDRLPDHN